MLKILSNIFSKEYLDIVLSTSQEYETRIIERPGLWMTSIELAALRQDLIAVASKTLDRGALTYGVFREGRVGLENAVITLIQDKSSGQPVAFNALAVMEVNHGGRPMSVLHLGLVMVDPQVRSRGFAWVLYGLTCVLFLLRNQFRPLWISNVTQVPAIVGMVSESFSNVYPQPEERNRRSMTHLLLAREIMTSHRHVFGVGNDADFDEERFVIKNAYTGGSDDLKKSFDTASKHRDEIYNRFCSRELDYERGDDVLQLGQIDLLTTKDYLLKTVPRHSIMAIVGAAVFVLLQRVTLPIVYWFNTSRPWGHLRGRDR